MNERDIPFEKVKFGKETVELTPSNTHIYRHFGHYAMFDHIFIHWERPGDKPDGMGYIWVDSPLFQKLHDRSVLQSVAYHQNLNEVSDLDFNNYWRHHSKDLEVDNAPDWLPEL
ncbi:MAG TPA: hypothetical protein VN081_03405 [Dongiaceae bacterium]|nr:hypothetical protein [Dongiaceae bacterium]